MLQQMRSHAGSWVIKGMLGAIIASFALWGITDIIRGVGQNRPIATMGDLSVSRDDFAARYKIAMANIQAQFKDALTPRQLREMNIAEKVLDQLIDETILKEDMHRKGLVLSENTLKREIQSIPTFLDGSHRFDAAKFRDMLRSQGISEHQFISEITSEMARSQWLLGMSTPLRMNDAYAHTLFTALQQPFTFKVMDIALNKVPLSAAPTPADIETFFSRNSEMFRVPERRGVTLLILHRSAVLSSIPLSQNDLNDAKRALEQSLMTPEVRRIQSVLFTSSSAAKEGQRLINSGKPLKAVARELLGTVQKEIVLVQGKTDHPHSLDLFALKKGDASKIYDTPAGWVVYDVVHITPPKRPSAGDVEKKARSTLQNEKLDAYVTELQNNVEDDLAAGMSFKEVAEKYALSTSQHSAIRTLPLFDKNGLGTDGKPVASTRILKDVTTFAFENDEGTDSSLMIAHDTSEDTSEDLDILGCVVRIDTVSPSHIPEFKDIRLQVTRQYTFAEQNKVAADTAYGALKAKSLKELEAYAKLHKYALKDAPAVSPSSIVEEPTFSSSMSKEDMERMFSLKPEEAMVARTADGYRVVVMTGQKPFSIDAQKLQEFKKALNALLRQDMFESYLAYLKTSVYPIEKDTALLKQMTGDEDTDA